MCWLIGDLAHILRLVLVFAPVVLYAIWCERRGEQNRKAAMQAGVGYQPSRLIPVLIGIVVFMVGGVIMELMLGEDFALRAYGRCTRIFG